MISRHRISVEHPDGPMACVAAEVCLDLNYHQYPGGSPPPEPHHQTTPPPNRGRCRFSRFTPTATGPRSTSDRSLADVEADAFRAFVLPSVTSGDVAQT